MRQHGVSRWIRTVGLAATTVLMIPASDLLAFRIALMNLEQMATRAQRVVAGVCTARQEKTMTIGGKELVYTEYTFQVNDRLKGSAGETLTIRQVNLKRRLVPESTTPADANTPQPTGLNPVPLPEYQPGQEIILFLAGESELGLTSPIGMQQGVFDVQNVRGEKFVTNRLGNNLVLRGVSDDQLRASGLSPGKAKDTGAPLPYGSFVSLVKKLSQGK